MTPNNLLMILFMSPFAAMALWLFYMMLKPVIISTIPVSWLAGFVPENERPILDLIAEDPNGWSVDTYWFTHSGANINMWIGNGAFALRIRVNRSELSGYGTNNGLSGNAKQQVFWRAYRQWRKARDRSRAMTEAQRSIEALRQLRELRTRADAGGSVPVPPSVTPPSVTPPWVPSKTTANKKSETVAPVDPFSRPKRAVRLKKKWL